MFPIAPPSLVLTRVRMRCVRECTLSQALSTVRGVSYWDGSATWDEESTATGYELDVVYRGTDTDYFIRQCCSASLDAEVVERFRVRAFNSAGSGPWSAWIQVPEPIAVPGVVTGVAYRDGRAVWQAASGSDYYRLEFVYRDGGAGATSDRQCCEVGISQDRIAEFRIRAGNAAGTGPWSAWIQLPEPEDIAVEVRPPGVVGSVEFRDDRVHWQALDDAETYQVEWRYDDAASTITTVACSTRCSLALEVVQGKTLEFRVRAGNDEGWGRWSSWDEVTPISTERLVVPEGVAGLQFRSGQAVWNAAPGATEYVIRLWNGSSGRNVRGVACCRYSIDSGSGITQFNVQAVNSVGAGPWAGWVHTALSELPQVTGVRFLPGSPSLLWVLRVPSVTWDEVSDATSFEVEWFTVRGEQERSSVDTGLACCTHEAGLLSPLRFPGQSSGRHRRRRRAVVCCCFQTREARQGDRDPLQSPQCHVGRG